MEADPIQQSNQKSEEGQDENISAKEPVNFDWANRWLKGPEYAFILKNIDAYCSRFGFQKYEFKTHPTSIYGSPINGTIYFVRGKGVGSEFGFPRVATRKRYRWKKMNFTTDLPKQHPHVTYVVASAMKSQQIEDESELPNYRMHSVIPHRQRNKEYQTPCEYILCHVRKVEKKKNSEQETPLLECFPNSCVDFYKLFAHLHNFSLPQKER